MVFLIKLIANSVNIPISAERNSGQFCAIMKV